MPENWKLILLKPMVNLQDKKEYVIHIKVLKQAWNHGLVLKKVQGGIKFLFKKACLKSYIGINTEVRKKVKYASEKDFFKLMINAGFRKTMENVTKHRDIKLLANEAKRLFMFI